MSIYFWNRLPTTYQEVEWIGSSATQYINTGYIPNINTEIETDLSWWSSQAEWWVFFWMTSNDNWQDGICGRIYSSSPTIFNPRFLNSAYWECQITTTTDTFHKVILKKNYCTLDWTAWTLTTTYSSPYNWAIYLFCGNNWWSAWRRTSVKFKSFKISESWTLKRNFVPCYRKSDNVIWLYDTVNNQFYTNAWSWTFTKWSNVYPDKLKKLYRWNILIVWDPIPDPEDHSYWTIQWYVDSGESMSISSASYNTYTCWLNISGDWKKLYCGRSAAIAPYEITLNNWSLSWATATQTSWYHPGWWWWPCEVVWNADGTVFYMSQDWSWSWTRAYRASTPWSTSWWTQIQNIWKTICSRWRYLDTVNWEYAVSMWPWGDSNWRLSTWKLWTAWDVSSDFTLVSYNNIWNTSQEDGWIFFNADWTHMYLWKWWSYYVAHYKLSTPRDVSTCTLVEQYNRSDFWLSNSRGWGVVFHWTNMYLWNNNTLKRYTVTYNQ